MTASVNGVSCTNAAASLSNGVVTVTCEAPGIATEGTYDVSVGVGGYSYNKTSTGVYEIKPPTCTETLGPNGTGTWGGYSAGVMSDGNCWTMVDVTRGSWDTIMNGESSNSVSYSVQGLCPDGWYVPTRRQLEALQSTDLLNKFGLNTATEYYWWSSEGYSGSNGSADFLFIYQGIGNINGRPNWYNHSLRCVTP